MINRSGGEKGPVTKVDVYSGTDGLLMEFLDGMPPKEMYEPEKAGDVRNFRASVEMKNDGAYDINEGYITIGIEKDYMSIDKWGDNDKIKKDDNDEQHATFKLKGKSLEVPRGEQTILSLDIGAKKILDNQSVGHTSTIQVTACYKYQTTASADVCIDTDAFAYNKEDKACEVKDIKLDDQGAPIAVTNIETNMFPEGDNIRPHFIIQLENKGNGEVLKEDSDTIAAACKSTLLGKDRPEQASFNVVSVRAWLSENKELDCNMVDPKNVVGRVRFRDDIGKVRCSSADTYPGKEGSFTSPLKIVIDYGYTFTVAEEVTVKRITDY